MIRKLLVTLAVLVIATTGAIAAAPWGVNSLVAQFSSAQTMYVLLAPPASGTGNIILRYIAVTTAGAGELYLSDDTNHTGGIRQLTPEWELAATAPLVLPDIHKILAIGCGLYVTSDIAADHGIYVEYEILK